MERRIAVTGFGVVSSLSCEINDLWEKVCQGKTAIARIQNFDTSEMRTAIGGEIVTLESINAEDYIHIREIKKLDNSSIYGLIAAHKALEMAGIPEGFYDSYRSGAFIGSGIGGLFTLEQQHRRLMDLGPRRISPYTIPRFIANLVCGNISIRYKLQGSSFTPVSACASGSHALGTAMDYIRLNRCDMIVAGAAEAALTPLSYAGFSAMRAMSERNDDPTHACRPFDRSRDGFVMSEGAGILILEEMEMAKKRGATIYAELVGYGSSSDAEHITHPNANGEGAAYAMRMALQDAKINPEQIGYINAHGTSTYLGDIAETIGIKTVFGEHAYKIPVSSTKSEMGHMLGASGAVEMALCIMAINNGVVPPTINLEEHDPLCDLDYVPHTAREATFDYALSNSFGFGGHNGSIIVKRFMD